MYRIAVIDDDPFFLEEGRRITESYFEKRETP